MLLRLLLHTFSKCSAASVPAALTTQTAAPPQAGCFGCCRKASPCKVRQCRKYVVASFRLQGHRANLGNAKMRYCGDSRKCVVACVPAPGSIGTTQIETICRNASLRRFPQSPFPQKAAVVNAPCACILVCRPSLSESAPSFTAQALATLLRRFPQSPLPQISLQPSL